MKCKECGTYEDEFDDRMGELICIGCGFVKDVHIFEETSPADVLINKAGRYLSENDDGVGKLGSYIQPHAAFGYHNVRHPINRSLVRKLQSTQQRYRNNKEASVQRGYMECNMILSPYLPNKPLQNAVHTYYKRLFYGHKFGGHTISIRACALTLICMREIGIPITIAEIAEKNQEDPHKISKCCRLLARHLGVATLLHSMPINPWIDRVCNDIVVERYGDSRKLQEWQQDARSVVEYIHNQVTQNDIHFSKSYMATSFWIVSMLRRQGHPEVTQQQICDACNCTAVALRKVAKRVFGMLKVDKEKLEVLTVEQFVSGVRYA